MADERLRGLEAVDAGRRRPGGGGRAGRDGVVTRAGEIGRRSGEADDTVFGSVVMRRSRRAGGRRGDDDAAVRRSEGRRHSGSGSGENAGQVGSDDGVPLAVVDLPGR